MLRGFFTVLILACSFSNNLSAKSLLPQDTTLAHEYLQKALVFKAQSQYDSSNSYLKLAAEQFKGHEVWHRYIFCQYNVGYNLSAQRKHKEALDYLVKVEEENTGLLNPERASTFGFYWQVAWAHFMLSNYNQALEYYNKVEVAMELCKKELKPFQPVRILYDKGVIHLRLSQYEQALNLMNEALARSEETGFHGFDSNIYNNLGIINRKIGDYERSLSFYEKAFFIAEKNFMDNRYDLVGLCPFYNNFSILYREMGDLEKSMEKAKEGLQVYNDNADRWWSVYSALKFSEIEVYFARNEFEKALEESRYSHAYILEQAQNEIQTAGIMRYLAKSYYYNLHYDSAELYFRKYLSLVEQKRSFIDGNAQVMMDLADLYWDMERKEEALSEVQKGITLIADGFDSSELENNPGPDIVILNSHILLDLLSRKTRFLLDMNDSQGKEYLQLANSSNVSARQIVDRLREQLFYKSSKLALGEFANKIYEQGIEINNMLYSQTGEKVYLDQLLTCFEGNRANLLAEAFQVSKVNGFTSLPDSIIESEISIYSQIAQKESRVLGTDDSSKVASLKEELFDLNFQYQEVLNSKRQFQFPGNYNNRLSNVSEIQNLLGRREILLEYFAGEEKYHLLAIRSNSIEYFDLGPVSTLDSLGGKFIDLTKNPKSVFNAQLGYELFDRVVRTALGDRNTESLIIIPDGVLSYLPFEALVSNPQNGSSITDYLINKFSVRSHYSAALFKTLGQNNVTNDLGTYIGFAPEFDGSSNPVMARRIADREGLVATLDKLPGAKSEVQNAAGLFNGDAIIGEGATESYFKESATKYDLIHLASHTLVDTERPLYSMLVFADEESDEDGLLHLYELYGMKLNCSLVSLSACNTGIGRSYKGEGMMSLGRGFMGAGAQNVMMTLWSVSDQSSSSIMNMFFEKIGDGTYEPEALRQAKLDYLSNADELTSHPYYWSGYVFIGNGSNTGINYLLWVIGTIFLFGAVIVYHRVKSSS